ncbi:MAG: glycosyltransferase [Planctomycetaceae bacterium]
MSINRRKRVLFISYLFPPVGGVGVQRVTKFVKYLPEFGWDSSVLTVSNPSVPLHDESYHKDIPANTIIRRAKTYEPGYAVKQAVASNGSGKQSSELMSWAKGIVKRVGNFVLQPDAQILWHFHAWREALKLLKEVPHDLIVATGPPFSSLVLGGKLAKRTGLPLILDYRDEWSISNAYWENKQQGTLANWIQKRQQFQAVRAADVLLATTPSSAQSVAEVALAAGSSARSTYIYNGFDSDDFPTAGGRIEKVDYGNGTDRFRLAFIGTLWNLNSIEPVVAAIERLSNNHPHLAGKLELLLAGRRMPEQEAIVDRLEQTECKVTRLPFVQHAEAVQLMQSADALLMLNSDVPHAHRIINAKTFEYMAARRPMFVVAPEGDVWDIVRDLPGTMLCPPSDVERIKDNLALIIEQFRCDVHFDDAHWDIDRFHRRQIAGQLATLLNATIGQPTSEPWTSSTPNAANTEPSTEDTNESAGEK